MSNKLRVMTVFGTRPEAIKMAPVVRALKDSPSIEAAVCVTAQHREMLDQALELFSIEPDFDLNIMSLNQDLTDITSNVICGLKPILRKFQPDYLLVHGDTTTTFAASLAAFYEKISVGHVEAGLRTGDIYSPWPEEINRKLVASIAKMNFAPTEHAKKNLLAEGIHLDSIQVTGNTVIDSLMYVKSLLDTDGNLLQSMEERFSFLDENKKLILMTVHRRENFGKPLENICEAILHLSMELDLQILIPVHPNPNVKEILYKYLGRKENIYLLNPLEYIEMIYLINLSIMILTDSGGLQEEAPSLGKPVLILRDSTERPEAFNSGLVSLVGSDTNNIIFEVTRYLSYQNTTELSGIKLINPFGDGRAAIRIVQKLTENSVDPL